MQLDELNLALKNGGAFFETIVLDACMMANLETAFDAEDYQKYNNGNAFDLEMVAKGAGDNPLESEITATIGTNLNIKGINVRMLGVTMAAGKAVTVENAKLEYYGTKEDDSLTVNVGNNATADIKTGDGADSVTVTVNKNSIDGTVADGAVAGQATVDTGAGDDKVEATVSDGATATITAGEGDDEVKLTDDAKTGTVTVSTGAGDDKVEVNAHTAGNGGITIDAGAGDDTVSLTSTAGEDKTPAGINERFGRVTVNLGGGMDRAMVDMSMADAIGGIAVTANQKIKDAVSAKAGAAGGTSSETAASVTETAKASASGGKADGKKNPDEQAQTSESTVGAAGAVAVNVQDSVSRSEIMNGVNVNASGTVAVTALNGTTTKVKANASATNSDVGVGVGVAVNIAGLANIAKIGDGQISAAILKVAATTKEKTPEEKEAAAAEEKKDENKDQLKQEITEAVTGFVDDLIQEMGLEAAQPKTTGHVFDTQAIAGAGAREVGVAGSVAITVVNAETSATIAKGGNIMR